MQKNVYYIDPECAKKYGFEEAALLSHIVYWIQRNKANGKNFHDDKTWTYQSLKAFVEMFPFWSKRQIERMLEKLKTVGVLITGNYNNSAYDRTLWYALKDENAFLRIEESISLNREIEKTKPGNDIIGSIPEDITEKKTEEIVPEFRECSDLLKKRVLETRQQKITEDTLIKWDNTVRLMVQRDSRTLEDIKKIINECHDMPPRGNGFTWRDNILSMETCRQRWNEGKIYIGMNKNINNNKEKGGLTW